MAIIQSIDVSTAIQFVAWFDIRPYPQLGTAVPTSLHTSLGLTNNEAEDWGGGLKRRYVTRYLVLVRFS